MADHPSKAAAAPAEEDGGLLMEFFVSMVTPGMVGPRLERLLFGCLGALALVLVLVWWRAGPDVAPHALALLALTALLSASLFWVLGELRVAKEQQSAKQRQGGDKNKNKNKKANKGAKKENAAGAANAAASSKQRKTTDDNAKQQQKKKKSKAN